MAGTELTDTEMDDIIGSFKEGDDDMQVVRGGSSKRPSRVQSIEEEALPIDEETRRKMDKETARKNDKVLKTLENKITDPRALEALGVELGEEIFSLKYERERLEAAGRDIANTSGRRVTAIKALIDTQIKLREITKDGTLDFNSEAMKIVMRMIFTKIQESMKESGQDQPSIQSFFQLFQKNMESFEVEAQRLIEKGDD